MVFMEKNNPRIPKFAINGINLASPRLNSDVIYATDDFFADKNRLIKVTDPIFIPDKYDNNGKWMDGWESKRRRTPGNDYCIIRLGTKGIIKGVDIDTSFFTGNHPPKGSIEAAFLEQEPDKNTTWTEILTTTDLSANNHNYFEISNDKPFNYIRLNIFPDGGVARLRVYGMPVGVWEPNPADGLHELSAIINGGNIVGFNDAHYGDPWVILAPGRGENMGDGWETRRRRVPGNDWIVISLGSPGIVKRVEVDTAHFKGNYPDSCSVQGALIKEEGALEMLTDKCDWQELMGQQKLEMDKIHTFGSSVIKNIGAISHVRLNIYPDGGVSRFRLFGDLYNHDF